MSGFPVSAVQVRYRSSRKQSEKLAQPTDKSKGMHFFIYIKKDRIF